MSGLNLSRSFELIVRYAETDAQGVVHHSNYLRWFEEGRSDFLRQQGIHYRDWEAAGMFVVVANAEVNYKSPAYFEDRVTITTTIEKLRGPIIVFSYTAVNQDGVLLAEGQTRHMALNKERQPTRLPEELVGAILGEGD